MKKVSSRWIYVLAAFACIALDQWTKALIHAKLAAPGAMDIPIIPHLFELEYSRNTGIAFGLFKGMKFFMYLSPVVALVLFGILLFYPTPSRMALAGLAMMAGGAVGNIIDRIRLGFVVDFLHVYYKTWSWPNFNVADSCIVVGAIIFAVAGLLMEPDASEALIEKRAGDG